MDKQTLYDRMASRKSQPKDFNTYIGDNGRVNRCVDLFLQKKLKSGGSILDVGGGIGDLGYAVTKQHKLFNWAAVLDISTQNLVAAQSKGCSGILADVDKEGIPTVDNEYNAVTALDFIEHIVDPENFARECFRVLKPGGQVFINTPNIEFWGHIETLLRRGRFPHTSGDKEVFHGGHLAFFTFQDLCDIFQCAGFQSCQMFDEPENYKNPPAEFLAWRSVKNQKDYVNNCKLLGNSNLLFAAEKP